MRKMLYTVATAVVLIVYVFGMSLAFAGEWYGTLGAGAGRYLESAPQNPAWEQKGFDHVTNADATVWRLGAGYKHRPAVRAEVTYDDLGRFNKLGAWGCNDSESVCGPTRYGYSTARTRAVQLAGLFGDPLYVRLGVAAWHSTCDVYFSNADAHNKVFNHYSCTTARGYSPVFGAGARAGLWSLEVSRYTVVKPHDGSTQGISVILLSREF